MPGGRHRPELLQRVRREAVAAWPGRARTARLPARSDGHEVGAGNLLLQQQRNGLPAVVRIAVVEGDAHGGPAVDAAADPPLRLGQRDHLEMPPQPADLPREHAVGDGPGRRAVVGDAVIAEHGQRRAAGRRRPPAAPPAQRQRRLVVEAQEQGFQSRHGKRLADSGFEIWDLRLPLASFTTRARFRIASSVSRCGRPAKGRVASGPAARSGTTRSARLGRGTARKWAL